VLSVQERLIEDLAMRAGRLPKRSLVGLFWACGSGLLPAYRERIASLGVPAEPILEEVLAAAYVFAVSGREPVNGAGSLRAFEAATAPGGPVDDDGSEIAVQDCWICADVCIRLLVDSEYRPGLAVEYALEPVIQQASERLFGFSQVGEGPDEERQLEAILAESDVSLAVEFIMWATDFLAERPAPSEDDLEMVQQRAVVLAPREI
jgi:hypothetical protein